MWLRPFIINKIYRILLFGLLQKQNVHPNQCITCKTWIHVPPGAGCLRRQFYRCHFVMGTLCQQSFGRGDTCRLPFCRQTRCYQLFNRWDTLSLVLKMTAEIARAQRRRDIRGRRRVCKPYLYFVYTWFIPIIHV